MSMDFFQKKINTKIVFYFSIFFLLFSAQIAFAASLNLSPSSGSYDVGDTINVRIVLSSPVQSANAVSATVDFPKALLTLNSISKSNSLVSLWAQEPSYSNASGTANMEGVILNGYTGSNGTIVTLSFKAKAVGNANVKFTASSILANDGQGTNILTGAGQANFNITKAEEKVAPVTPVVENKSADSINIEELKKENSMDSSAKFLISSVGKKDKSSYTVEIDGVAYPWQNQKSNIFETPSLSKGKHVIKISMETVDKDIISDSLSFSINGILAPTFTEYSKNVQEKGYIVVKGLADPNIDVVLNSNAVLNKTREILIQEKIVKSDEKGVFAYVSDQAASGVYNITAYARAKNGSESEKTPSITIEVSAQSMSFLRGILNTFSLLIPIMAVIILLVIFAIWGWYKALYFQRIMRKKFFNAKQLVAKSFGILDEDVNEEVKIFKKIKALESLTKEERLFINQFKKDIEAAEKAILNEMK